ncbi:MAG: alanine racemase [Anaerolineaceae bacterium]|nr:alanine racemase [Anaerolineaceae bacterium]
MTIFSSIFKPTLLIHEEKAKKNLRYINEKILSQGKQFRPHFKTHQSAEIGEWFRESGISKITVSSIDMANYFAENKWEDIFIAFPVNILQIEDIVHLSSRISLSLMFEDLETVSYIDNHLNNPISGWIKIDTGANRCGLKNSQFEQILLLAEKIQQSKNIEFKGLATHAGHTYRFNNKEEICRVYDQSVNNLLEIKNKLLVAGIPKVEISVGDTPSSRLVDDFGDVDELRPGNFLFYDIQQYQAGVCKLDEIAVTVVCPVVAVHLDQKEVVIYGGAIHLSKDTHRYTSSINAYGLITFPDQNGWYDHKVFGYIRSLSQEHGVVVFPEGIPENIKSGSLLCVLPAHSCLAVQEMHTFINLDGEKIFTMLS